MTNAIDYNGTNCELHVFETNNGWHVNGFIGDAEIDTQWLEMDGLSFDAVETLILDVIAEEL